MPLLENLHDDVKPTMGSVLLDPGTYVATVVSSEVGDTYDGTGKQVMIEFEPADGGKVRHWFQYAGGTEAWMAKKGQEQLALLSECAGVPWGTLKANGTDVLHGRKVQITIKHKESKQLKDDGTPFINMQITNFQKADAAPATGATPPTEKAPW